MKACESLKSFRSEINASAAANLADMTRPELRCCNKGLGCSILVCRGCSKLTDLDFYFCLLTLISFWDKKDASQCIISLSFRPFERMGRSNEKLFRNYITENDLNECQRNHSYEVFKHNISKMIATNLIWPLGSTQSDLVH